MVKRKLTQQELIDAYYRNKAVSKAIKRVKQKKEKRENKGLRRKVTKVYGIVPGRGYEKERTQAIESFVKPTKSRPSDKFKRKILRETAEKVKKIEEKTKKEKTEKRERASKYRKKSIKGLFKSSGKGGRKAVSRRARGTSEVLKAFGVISGPASKSGAGRPRGTYKYGNMPIHVYKKMMRDKKAQYQMYQQEQAMKLRSRGFTPEQLQQLQQQQSIAEMQQPQEQEMEEYEETPQVSQEYQKTPQGYQETPQLLTQPYQVQQKQGYGRIIPRSQQVRLGRSIADDELDFRQWSAEKTISPRSQKIFDQIRRIQNKGKTDNIEMQRVLRERSLASRMMNILKSHENMINVDMDFTGTRDNILSAPNIWKENQNNNIMRTNRRNILDMQENNLKFF